MSTSACDARELADTVAESYRDYNRQIRNVRIIEARKYIEKQMQDAEARVKRAEEQVWAFREANRSSRRARSPRCCSRSSPSCAPASRRRGSSGRSWSWPGPARPHRSRQLRGARVPRQLEPGAQSAAGDPGRPLLERNTLALEVTDRHPGCRPWTIACARCGSRCAARSSPRSRSCGIARRSSAARWATSSRSNRDVPTVELALQRLQRDAKTNEDLADAPADEAPGGAHQGVGAHRGGHHRPAGHRAGRARSAATASTPC